MKLTIFLYVPVIVTYEAFLLIVFFSMNHLHQCIFHSQFSSGLLIGSCGCAYAANNQ